MSNLIKLFVNNNKTIVYNVVITIKLVVYRGYIIVTLVLLPYYYNLIHFLDSKGNLILTPSPVFYCPLSTDLENEPTNPRGRTL